MVPRWRIRLQADPLGTTSFYLLAALGDLVHTGEATVRAQARHLPREGGYWIEVDDAETGTRTAVSIDAWDGPTLAAPRRAALADVVWKRTFRADALTGPAVPSAVAAKVRPFGLWMSCRGGHEPASMLGRSAFVARGLARHDKAGLAMIRNAFALRRVFAGRRDSDGLPALAAHYEAPPVPAAARVVFQARLWDPAGSRASDDRRQVNAARAAVVRHLRAGLGDRFVGGLTPGPYLPPEYADCVTTHPVDPAGYQRLLLGSDIAVTTTGLHGSIPFSVGELLAASRALVVQRLPAEVDPPLRDGVETLGYDDPEGCVAACRALLDDPERRLAMMEAAHRYWLDHVRPGAALRRHLLALALP